MITNDQIAFAKWLSDLEMDVPPVAMVLMAMAWRHAWLQSEETTIERLLEERLHAKTQIQD